MYTKHKVFISYYHKDDLYYRDRFETLFGHLFIIKSVKPGDIQTDLSTDYIKHLIQLDYISNTAVIIVLVGRNTYRRKHVDWEISVALNQKVGNYLGLLGLCLPTHPDYNKDMYTTGIVPHRLIDNLKTGYARLYDWTEVESSMNARINDAFQAGISRVDKINNSRVW